jgi:hypothetical protein
MARGDHIKVWRKKGYWHHGIDCGDGTVIHYTGELFQRTNAAIRRTSLEEFAKGGKVRRAATPAVFDAESIISRAEARLHEVGYNPLLNNCEHFVRWCITGRKESKQVQRALNAAAGIAAVAVTVAGAAIFLRSLAGNRRA